MSSLGKMDSGIGIWLDEMDSVQVDKDGKTATIAGGALSKTVIDALWDQGKQTGMSGLTLVHSSIHRLEIVLTQPSSYWCLRMHWFHFTRPGRRPRLATGSPRSDFRPMGVGQHSYGRWPASHH